MRGSVILAGVLAGVWAVLYVVTQLVVDPPLGVLPTIATGLACTVAVVLGYPSVLRGPRGSTRSRAVTRRPDPDRGVGDLAAAGRTVPLRAGLTPDAARRTCELLRPMLAGDAVAITDTRAILAYVGPGQDHHLAGEPMQTVAAPRAVRQGRTQVVHGRTGVGCRERDCEVVSAVIAPLRIGQRVVGTLGVYQVRVDTPPKRLVENMANMLSLHLELAELDRERQLSTDARLDALRAPRSTRTSCSTSSTPSPQARTRPEEARELVLRLSEFFRYAVRQEGHFAEFAQEYFFVRTYLSLEQARFGERLAIRYDIDPQVLTSRVPVLTIQPLVENAVKHGIAGKKEGGTVRLRARVDPLTRTVSIRVSDDGVGMDRAVLTELADQQHTPLVATEAHTNGTTAAHAGVGLRNISERLQALFGDRYDLQISTPRSGGTVVDLTVPLR